MADWKYSGNADEVTFSKADFSNSGVEHDAVKFNAKNDWTASLSDEAAKVITDNGYPIKQVEVTPAAEKKGK